MMSCCGEPEFSESIVHSMRDGVSGFTARLMLCYSIKGNSFKREIEVGVAPSLGELDRLVLERLDLLERQRPGASTAETRERWAGMLKEAPESLGV